MRDVREDVRDSRGGDGLSLHDDTAPTLAGVAAGALCACCERDARGLVEYFCHAAIML